MDDTRGTFGDFGDGYITEEPDYHTEPERSEAIAASSEEICTHDCHAVSKNKKSRARQCAECDCIFCTECRRPIAGDYYANHIQKCEAEK